MTRLQANEKLIGILNRLVQNNPDLRFSQILHNFGFVKPDRPTKDAGDNWQNEFYLEPLKVLQRVTQRINNENGTADYSSDTESY